MFPPELLDADINSRIKYFKDKYFPHPILENTEKMLSTIIEEPADASLIVVYGPTGVGKTTLLNNIFNKIIADTLDDMHEDPGYIPVVRVEAVAPASGIFNMKDFYIRLLDALNEPLIDRKTGYSPQDITKYTRGRRVGTETEYRFACEKCLLYRRVSVVLIDEAQHMFKTGASKRLEDQMDTLKSLAKMSNTLFVLFGTSDLTNTRGLNPQLGRRTIRVHFPTYARGVASEKKAFAWILSKLRDHIPVEEPPPFRELFDYLFEGSLGCVGLLISWIVRALRCALEDGGKQLTRKHLDQTRMSYFELAEIAKDITDSEKAYRENKLYHTTIRSCIDRQPQPAILPKNGKSRSKKNSKKPFERNAGRDEITYEYKSE